MTFWCRKLKLWFSIFITPNQNECQTTTTRFPENPKSWLRKKLRILEEVDTDWTSRSSNAETKFSRLKFKEFTLLSLLLYKTFSVRSLILWVTLWIRLMVCPFLDKLQLIIFYYNLLPYSVFSKLHHQLKQLLHHCPIEGIPAAKSCRFRLCHCTSV